MSSITLDSDQKLRDDCKILMQAKAIMTDYYSNYSQDSNASKLDAYLTKIGDNMDNPFFMMKNNIKMSSDVIDAIFTIKQSQLLRLN